jgi:hypothetical protein
LDPVGIVYHCPIGVATPARKRSSRPLWLAPPISEKPCSRAVGPERVADLEQRAGVGLRLVHREAERHGIRRRRERHAWRELGIGGDLDAEIDLPVEDDGQRADRAEDHAETTAFDGDGGKVLGMERGPSHRDVVEPEGDVVVAVGDERANAVGEHALVAHGAGRVGECVRGSEKEGEQQHAGGQAAHEEPPNGW